MAKFKRFFKPAVRLITPDFTISNLDGESLTLTWEVERTNTNAVDTATITVLNLGERVRGGIFETWTALSRSGAYGLEFQVGWDGVAQTLIRGAVWRMVPARRSPTDVETVFHVGDGVDGTRDQVTGRTFKGVNLVTVLDYLVRLPPAELDAGGGGLGLIFPPESKALITTAAGELPVQRWDIPSGYNTRDAVNLIMDTLGLEWRIHNGEFLVMRGGIINRPPELVRPGTGLISYEIQNDGGLMFEALTNPNVEPGAQVLVQDDNGRPFGAPAYRVTRVVYSGRSDGDSTMVVECAKAVGA